MFSVLNKRRGSGLVGVTGNNHLIHTGLILLLSGEHD